MPKYYCEYCDIYLTHSSPGGRRQHNAGRKHINNKIDYFMSLIRDPSFSPPAYILELAGGGVNIGGVPSMLIRPNVYTGAQAKALPSMIRPSPLVQAHWGAGINPYMLMMGRGTGATRVLLPPNQTGAAGLNMSYMIPNMSRPPPPSIQSQLPSTQLINSQMPASQILGSQLPGSQLPNSQLPGSQLPGSQLLGSQLPGSQLSGSQLPGSQLPGSQMPGSQMPGSQMLGAQLPTTQMPTSQMPNSQVPASQIPGFQLPTTQLSAAQVTNQVNSSQISGYQMATALSQVPQIPGSQITIPQTQLQRPQMQQQP